VVDSKAFEKADETDVFETAFSQKEKLEESPFLV